MGKQEREMLMDARGYVNKERHKAIHFRDYLGLGITFPKS